MNNKEKLEALTNEHMIDLMYHQLTRFQSIRKIVLGKEMKFSTWQRWIRK